jgi:hypothetical protein
LPVVSNSFETWSPALREEHTIQMSKKQAPPHKKTWFEEDEVIGQLRILRNEESQLFIQLI